ncbi:MAG: helix-turn-helix domain-containing protein, partial [bacterium]
MSYSAEDKFNIVQYSLKHGIETTLEAAVLDSNRKLSNRTLIRWRNKWNKSCELNYGAGNKFDLKDRSKKPKNYRKSEVDGRILQFIQKQRLQHPNLGKDKLKVLLDNYCNEHNLKDIFNPLTTISTSTIGRIISS